MSSREASGNVFVVHGRDARLRRDFFTFLRALGIKPLEWTGVLRLMPGNPYVGDLLEKVFDHVSLVVVLFSGDDEARLRADLKTGKGEAFERRLTPQPRPNVLFEAGMAFAFKPDRTLLVQVGSVRPISDIAGRYIVKLDNSTARRFALSQRLEDLGCKLDLQEDWLEVGDLRPTRPRPTPTGRKPRPSGPNGPLADRILKTLATSAAGLTVRTLATRVSEPSSEVRGIIENLEELGLVGVVRKPRVAPKVRLSAAGKAQLLK